MKTTRESRILAVCGAVWLGALATGAKILWEYQTTPGKPASSPSRWPSDSRVHPQPGQFTLVMMAHPHCACTRASLAEMASLMGRLRGRVSAHVLVFKPREFPAGWEKTDVWESAERIPGVAVWADVDGTEAALFRAQTSGQVVLYDAHGRLVFTGGLTSARGQRGVGIGYQRIVSLVTTGAADAAASRVFGCALGQSEDG